MFQVSKKAFAALLMAPALALVPAACATPATAAQSVPPAVTAQTAAITEADVIAAQNAWGNALVAIATAYDTKGIEEARKVAEGVIDSAYGYEMVPVLFKPTLAAPPTTFRTTRDGALSYFIGQDADYPGDSGFALKGWRSFEIENAGIYIDGDTAISMGNVHVTDKDGKTTTVDKTWAWTLGDDGKMKIVLHHSSLPYSAN
jgi:hypothetical protein